MKTTKQKLQILLLAAATGLLSSCGFNNALIVNHNQNNTQVQLSTNNFKVIDKVYGKAEITYICLIGGLDTRQAYENAYSDMLGKANLTGSSKAVINVITEEHLGGVPPFYYKRTITVSAHVIEFTR